MRMNRFFNVMVALVMLLMTSCSSFPEQQTSKAITDVMDEFQAVGISAAVVKDGKIVYNKSFGYKDLATKTLLGNDDVMRIASISKSCTATSLLQLVDKGVIS
jgi:CubicO group peptidase (beta-lactamase class C family)